MGICKDDHMHSMTSIFIFFISSLGLLTLSKHLIIPLTKWAHIHFLRPPKPLAASYGPWALVTGSTDGIGKAFAFQLARHGLNLVLLSRSPDKLARVSREIEGRFPGRSVKAVAIDLADEASVSGAERAVEEAIAGLEVGMLVNNVGITYPRAMYFDDVGEEVWRRVVRVNVEGTTRVTRAVLKGMVRRRRGAVVNVSSGAGIVVPSHPLFAVYAATKAYIDKFSRSLYVEYKAYGIDVQCQVPLYVATKMVSRVTNSDETTPKPSLFTPTADDYAKAAIDRIGYESRCTPYWAHSLQWTLASLVPDSLLDAWRLSIGLQRRAITPS